MQVVQTGFRIVVVATVAERVEGADGVYGGIFKLYEFAPGVVGVGGGELAGLSVGEGYYITLQIIWAAYQKSGLLLSTSIQKRMTF